MQTNKKILYGDEARAELKKGIDIVANAVKITLGPVGRNVAIGHPYGSPIITNDGVSIAQSIKVKDPFQQMGVKIAQEVASKTDSVAGDGTTTTLILFQAIIEEGLNEINNKTNVMDIKRGIEEGVKVYVEELRKQAKPVTTFEEIKNVAYISVEDEEVANTIAKILYKIGVQGLVTVEESDKAGVNVEETGGMKINKGYASEYVINNFERMVGDYDDVPVLITSKKVLISKDLIPLLEKLASSGQKKLLLIADDIDGEALASFTMNKARNLFDIIPVRFPVFGEGKYDELEDIAIRCGTFVVGDRSEKQIKDVKVEDLGHVDKCQVKRDTTLLINGKGNVHGRVGDLSNLKDTLDIKESKDIISTRISNLLSKVAIIKVGATTDTERRYLKLKIDDAVNATKGAMEEGVVAGGGWALVDIFYLKYKDGGDVKKGIDIIKKATEYPFIQLLKNCGVSGKTFFGYNTNMSQGYNAKTGRYTTDLVKEGVVDPVKVTINALQNAASAAALFLTTEVIIADEEEIKQTNET